MKKILFLLAMLPMVVFTACSSSEDSPTPDVEKIEVSFLLDYTFESGSMSRSNDEVYDEFYESNIKTKLLVTDDYQIEFRNKESGTSYKCNGKWSNEDRITLPVGVYKVIGESYAGKSCSEKASIKFEKDIEIKADTKRVVLEADYDCWLIMFAKSNIKSIQYFCVNPKDELKMYKDYFYAFCQNESGYPYFLIKRENGSSFEFKIDDDVFENGKYYFFNDDDEASTFNIPKMSAGN